jgi:hypothetical protein
LSGFDHTDPEIQDLMVQRSLDQSRGMRGSALYGYQGKSHSGMRRAMKEADPIAAILDEYEDEVLIDGISLGGSGISLYASANGQAWQRVGLVLSVNMASAVSGFERLQKEMSKLVSQQLNVSLKVADQLIDHVGGVIDQAKPAIEKLGILTDDEQERLRHGHAVVCPKHGPTKGGTCFKCQRGRHRARF